MNQTSLGLVTNMIMKKIILEGNMVMMMVTISHEHKTNDDSIKINMKDITNDTSNSTNMNNNRNKNINNDD